MARPRGSKNKVEEAQGVETTTKTEEVVIKNPTPKKEETPLKKSGAFLANVNGVDQYWSRTMLDIAFKRNSHSINIPKGSDYIPPVDANCENCG